MNILQIFDNPLNQAGTVSAKLGHNCNLIDIQPITTTQNMRKLILSTPRNLLSNSDSQTEELNLSDSKTLEGIKCQMQKIHFESAKIKL